MGLIWHLYWPLLLASLVIGIVAGRYAFLKPGLDDEAPAERKQAAERTYRTRKRKGLLAGVLGLLAAVSVWHGPLGAGDRFASTVERLARGELEWLEMPMIEARIVRSPLTRTLVMTGPANDFQQAEMMRIFETTPGISRVRWQGAQARAGFRLPLFVEVTLIALIAFGLGLLLSYFIEIRRRVNAEWSW